MLSNTIKNVFLATILFAISGFSAVHAQSGYPGGSYPGGGGYPGGGSYPGGGGTTYPGDGSGGGGYPGDGGGSQIGQGPVSWSVPNYEVWVHTFVDDFYNGNQDRTYQTGQPIAALYDLTFEYSWNPYASKQQSTAEILGSTCIEFTQVSGVVPPPGTVYRVHVHKSASCSGTGSVSFLVDTGDPFGAAITEDNTSLMANTGRDVDITTTYDSNGHGKLVFYLNENITAEANQINTFDGANGIDLSASFGVGQPTPIP